MNATALVLTLFISWTLFLLLLMEVLRSQLVVTRRVPANGFQPDNANLSPFMQRLARAHANCVESFPVFGGLLIVALLTERSAITDPLAPWLMLARVVQSGIHLASLSEAAVTARFSAFALQTGIAVYWAWALLMR
ncbi:MAG: MAPEG family protein [Rhodocyclales bacterium RIFCSPLOWO2_02_FULL_63_24]|nr:MAG: MAPEG family protein [Rhodocyclales bacterium GWA2_65_19]OHC67991.1 MAG: MAPEG family protein [Rhodocyclales bacterium RIFCSPLOWO2_02_FULL_63_24]